MTHAQQGSEDWALNNPVPPEIIAMLEEAERNGPPPDPWEGVPEETVTILHEKQCPFTPRYNGDGQRNCVECQYVTQPMERRIEKPTRHIVRYETTECLRSTTLTNRLYAAGLFDTLHKRTFAAANRGGKRGAYLKVLEAWKHESGRGLFIYGTNGTGKSYSIHCLVHKLCDENVPVGWTTSSGMIQVARSAMSQKSNGSDPLQEYLNVRVLAIDDVGKEAMASDWGREVLFRVVDERTTCELPMLITSNWDPDSLALKLGENYGAAIVDRIVGSCDVIEMSGESLRGKL